MNTETPENTSLVVAVTNEALEAWQKELNDLRALIRMYDAYCAEKCPFSYVDGWRAKPLRDEKKRLLGENN